MDVNELLAREQVRDTLARYNHAGDQFRLAELTECFLPDGVLEIVDQTRLEGREQIEAGLRKFSGNAPNNPDILIRHYVASLSFTSVAPARIETAAYFVVFHKDAADHWGSYTDVLVPSGDRWLFEHRRVAVQGGRPGTRALPRR